jgi:PAS domain S-box-containing protein
MEGTVQPDLPGRQYFPYAWALLATAAALWARSLFEPWLQGQLPFVTVFGAVAFSVWIGGVAPAVLAALAGFVGGSFWWLGKGAVDFLNPGVVFAACSYAISCGLIIAFGEGLRRTQRRLGLEIAQRGKAERDVAKSIEHYRHTVNFNPVVAWTAEPDGRFDHLADRWREWTGVDGLGDGWLATIHPDDLEATRSAWRHSLGSGSVFDIEHRVKKTSGEYHWMRARAFPLHNEQGAIVKWYGTTNDVNKRKTAEAKLNEMNAHLEQQIADRTAAFQASEARMRTVFSTTFQYQGLLSPDGTLLDTNATSLRGIDAKLEDVVGRPFWQTPWFSATPGAPDLVREGVQAAAQGRSLQRELRLRLPSGWRSFDFAMRPVRDADGGVVAIVPEAIDITERSQAEEQLRQAQKMEAVGQLTGGVAHDFNNLLQVISANLHLIGKFGAGNARIEQRLNSAHEAVKRGAKLANQLLAFGRRQALEPKVVNIGRFVSGIEDMVRRSIGEGVEVETVISAGLWNTFVDTAQIENAVLNLAINARDAMNGNGRLTIEVGNAILDNAYAQRHADVVPGPYVMLAVSDTGTGMSGEVIAQAFEPFFSTKPAGSGTGLGLSMVYGFVKQSGGHVKIYSELGRGTTVKLYLPRSLQAEDAIEVVPNAPVAGGSETVLVVEDDAAVRETTVDMLAALGYRVLKAGSADAALPIVESGAAIDLLFTDVVMPGQLRSPELARTARERLPDIAVLFTSGYTQNAIVHDGRLDAGVELLAKPYTLEALAQRIRLLLDQPAPGGSAGGAAPAAPQRVGAAVALTVLFVEDDDLVRSSTAELLRDLGHVVTEARSAEQAMAILRQQGVDVLVTDIGLPGMSGDVFAAQARSLHPTIGIVFATGKEHIVSAERDGNGPVLLRKPFDSVGIASALNAARRQPG